jgi:hypothetical protein
MGNGHLVLDPDFRTSMATLTSLNFPRCGVEPVTIGCFTPIGNEHPPSRWIDPTYEEDSYCPHLFKNPATGDSSSKNFRIRKVQEAMPWYRNGIRDTGVVKKSQRMYRYSIIKK